MKNIIKELLPYVLILGGVILIRTFIVTPVIVSGDSMKPNLHNGELLFERKIGYSGSSIKRFDIVVIREGKEEIISTMPQKTSYFKIQCQQRCQLLFRQFFSLRFYAIILEE